MRKSAECRMGDNMRVGAGSRGAGVAEGTLGGILTRVSEDSATSGPGGMHRPPWGPRVVRHTSQRSQRNKLRCLCTHTFSAELFLCEVCRTMRGPHAGRCIPPGPDVAHSSEIRVRSPPNVPSATPVPRDPAPTAHLVTHPTAFVNTGQKQVPSYKYIIVYFRTEVLYL